MGDRFDKYRKRGITPLLPANVITETVEGFDEPSININGQSIKIGKPFDSNINASTRATKFAAFIQSYRDSPLSLNNIKCVLDFLLQNTVFAGNNIKPLGYNDNGDIIEIQEESQSLRQDLSNREQLNELIKVFTQDRKILEKNIKIIIDSQHGSMKDWRESMSTELDRIYEKLSSPVEHDYLQSKFSEILAKLDGETPELIADELKTLRHENQILLELVESLQGKMDKISMNLQNGVSSEEILKTITVESSEIKSMISDLNKARGKDSEKLEILRETSTKLNQNLLSQIKIQNENDSKKLADIKESTDDNAALLIQLTEEIKNLIQKI